MSRKRRSSSQTPWVLGGLVIIFVGLYLDTTHSTRKRGVIRQVQLESQAQVNTALDREIARVRGDSSSAQSIDRVAGGEALLLRSQVTLTEAMIWAQHDKRGGATDTTALWSVAGDADAAASAPGLDNRHHFVNAYLEGYKPFHTDNLWMPLYTIARVKTYEFDHASVTGFRERWQTSREAFYYNRGDCEDHALALADWLIEMGEDARVVLGDLRDSGHAWVVLFKDDNQYLLEATEKHRKQGPRALTLTIMRPSYHPKMMFNRDDFWLNTASPFTVDYAGSHWVRKSRYRAPGGRQ